MESNENDPGNQPLATYHTPQTQKDTHAYTIESPQEKLKKYYTNLVEYVYQKPQGQCTNIH